MEMSRSIVLIVIVIISFFAFSIDGFHEGKHRHRDDPDPTIYIPDKGDEMIAGDLFTDSSEHVENVMNTDKPTLATSTAKTTKAPTIKKESIPTDSKRTSAQQRTANKKSPKKAIQSAPSSPTTLTLGTTESTIDLASTGDTSATQQSTSTVKTPTAKSIPSTTMTPKPTSTVKPEVPPHELYCLCDLHRNTCDMNCCCDQDCGKDERTFFSKCEEHIGIHDEKSPPRRQRSCYNSFVTFKNYETTTVQKNDKGMLCIVRDNNKADNILSVVNLDEISKRIANGQINIENNYGSHLDRQMEYDLKSYKYGSPILGIKAEDLTKDNIDELVPFGLPATYHDSSSCRKVREPVRFLENVFSQCTLSFTNLAQDCEKDEILNASAFVGLMHIVDNPVSEDPQLLPISYRVCNEDLCSVDSDSSADLDFSKPKLNVGKKLCQDVLVGLNLTFNFELDGITGIEATAQLRDVPLDAHTLVQEYHAKFVWDSSRNETATTMNANATEVDWPRSGNPGYIVGKPVIMGEKVKVEESLRTVTTSVAVTEIQPTEGSKVVKDMILVWKDPSRWMTIHAPGLCSLNPRDRKSVNFDFSHLSTCLLNITSFKTCDNLQIEVAKILLGVEDPLMFEKRSWHIAAFGNSNPEEPSEWVFPTYKNFQFPSGSKSLTIRGCNEIVSSLHITIAYAFVGPYDFPQAKITGVLYELGESVSILADSIAKDLSLITTVAFKDVTEPPIMRVAKWPVLSIRLPNDFFYPFSSSS